MIQAFPGFIVGLREGLEAFLIIALILEYLKKIERRELQSSVARGLGTGIAVSVLLGAVLWVISLGVNSSSAVAKLWEAGASMTAVIFITYFIYWMIVHGHNMTAQVRGAVDADPSRKGLFLLSTVAVAREGAEIALFTFTAEDKIAYMGATGLGILAAAVLAWLIYKSLVKVDIGLIFKITLVYLILQAAYLAGYAVHELLSALKTMEILDSAHVIYNRVYNFQNTILDHKKGGLGLILNVGIGWYSKPEYLQFFIQIFYLAAFGLFWRSRKEK